MYLIPEKPFISHLRALFLIKGVPTKGMSEFLDIFEINDKEKHIKQLSGGGKRKLSLMSALIGSPQYLFLDEPTIGIDEHSQNIFGRFVDALITIFSAIAI